MNFIKLRSLSLAVGIGLAALFILLGLLGMTSAVLAQAQGPTVYGKQAEEMQAPPVINFTIVLTDPVYLEIYDLAGNPAGEGVHLGMVRCNGDNCNKDTQLYLTVPLTYPWQIEYKFKSRQAFDPEAGRAVVAGTGTINSGHQKERFLFTATFADNRDGTVSVTYAASRPEASFFIPRSPGTFDMNGHP